MSKRPSIGVIGIGEPGYGPRIDQTVPELVHAAARAALADAPIDRDAIDNVVACASDLDDGRAIASMTTAAPGGAYLKDYVKTTNSGIHAIELAMLRMEAGQFDTALVLSWGKGTEADLEESVRLEGEPFTHRGTGIGHRSGHAIEAAAYHDGHPEPEAADWLVEHDTRMGATNPRVEGCAVVEASTVANSPVRAWPLREAHLPPESDGSSGLVLATAEFIESNGIENPVWLRGVGRQTASYNAGERPLGRLAAASTAARRAYDEAGLDPTTADVVELHGASAFHELMALEALDIVPDTPTVSTLERRFEAGETALNPSGGALAANPLIGAGLARVAAAARELRGGPPATAVAHATAGFTDQVHGVAALEGGVDA